MSRSVRKIVLVTGGWGRLGARLGSLAAVSRLPLRDETWAFERLRQLDGERAVPDFQRPRLDLVSLTTQRQLVLATRVGVGALVEDVAGRAPAKLDAVFFHGRPVGVGVDANLDDRDGRGNGLGGRGARRGQCRRRDRSLDAGPGGPVPPNRRVTD